MTTHNTGDTFTIDEMRQFTSPQGLLDRLIAGKWFKEKHREKLWSVLRMLSESVNRAADQMYDQKMTEIAHQIMIDQDLDWDPEQRLNWIAQHIGESSIPKRSHAFIAVIDGPDNDTCDSDQVFLALQQFYGNDVGHDEVHVATLTDWEPDADVYWAKSMSAGIDYLRKVAADCTVAHAQQKRHDKRQPTNEGNEDG